MQTRITIPWALSGRYNPACNSKRRSQKQNLPLRIDESQSVDNQVIRGIVWSFESEKSVPIITQQPQKVRADLGGIAVITVKATRFANELPVAQERR